MSDAAIPAGAGSPKLDPETLVLRANPRPVTRFKRKVVIAALGGTALAVLAAAWMALGSGSHRAPVTGQELYNIDRHRGMTRFTRQHWVRRFPVTLARLSCALGKDWDFRSPATRPRTIRRAPKNCGWPSFPAKPMKVEYSSAQRRDMEAWLVLSPMRSAYHRQCRTRLNQARA